MNKQNQRVREIKLIYDAYVRLKTDKTKKKASPVLLLYFVSSAEALFYLHICS